MIHKVIQDRFRDACRLFHGDSLGDVVADSEIRNAESLAQTRADLRAKKLSLEAQIVAQAAVDSRTLDPLRKRAEEALRAHIDASERLEAGRIAVERKHAAIRTQIAEIDRQLAAPIKNRLCGWEAREMNEADARVLAAALAPTQAMKHAASLNADS
jgi:hypothetical protein